MQYMDLVGVNMLLRGDTKLDEDAFVSSERMKEMLDTIDKVRTTLGGLKNNNDFYEELLSSLPQFVACGPQSAGKSSVIRRVSGVSLPEASTLCTRMATIIQMRRSSSNDEKSTTITLTGPNGKKMLENTVVGDRSTSVRDFVKKAQEKALKMFPNKQFIQDHSIDVYVEGPNLVNVTLVDLPGFHTSDDTDTKTVNDMVKRYIEMPGTLVLHVVKGDQDYASLLGNDFMRHAPQHDAGRVTVLTHCDKLDVKSEADAIRLQTTLDTTTTNSTLTIAVLGCAKKDDEEENQLRKLTTMDHRLEVGAKDLSIHLEERMRKHLNTQFPKAIAKLETSLSDTCVQLDAVRERSSVEILCMMSQTILKNYEYQKRGLMNDLRTLLDTMTMDIKNFKLTPVVTKSNLGKRHIDQFDEELESGQSILYGGVEYVVVKVTGNAVTVRDMKGTLKPSALPINSNMTSRSGSGNGDLVSVDCMVKDIEKLAHDRGMRNLIHADRHPIISEYAFTFAEYYKSEINKTLIRVFEKLEIFYDGVFSSKISDTAKPASEHLRVQMRVLQSQAKKLADQAINALVEHNTDSDLVFSPNEHYLNALVQQMIEADTGIVSDKGAARIIYHNVRAFIKVQRKCISELASKEVIRTTILETGKRFTELLNSTIGESELVDLIKEPSKVARERHILLNRKKVLEEALALAKECH